MAIFNRSHYEDVLVTRVHELIDKEVWANRYERINDFENDLADSGTHILKFFLHISKDEQLARFARGSMTRRATGKSVSRTTPNASTGMITSTPSRTR